MTGISSTADKEHQLLLTKDCPPLQSQGGWVGKQEHSSKPAESTCGATSPTNNHSSTTLRQRNPNEQVPSASDVHHSMKQQDTAHDMYSAHGSHFLSLAGHPANRKRPSYAFMLGSRFLQFGQEGAFKSGPAPTHDGTAWEIAQQLNNMRSADLHVQAILQLYDAD